MVNQHDTPFKDRMVKLDQGRRWVPMLKLNQIFKNADVKGEVGIEGRARVRSTLIHCITIRGLPTRMVHFVMLVMSSLLVNLFLVVMHAVLKSLSDFSSRWISSTITSLLVLDPYPHQHIGLDSMQV